MWVKAAVLQKQIIDMLFTTNFGSLFLPTEQWQ